MLDEKNVFGLSCVDDDAPAPVLVGVQASGRLEGVLFEMTLRQTYRNQSRDLLEVVYTFPMPHEAVLLGFASELNGERKVGTVVAKPEAERQYEKSLSEGDAPVMLEADSEGMHTANIGNLKPGDEIVLEVRFGQLLAFEQGRLRLAIPTTIAPRYGCAEAAGLQPQQVPISSLEVEYPLALSIAIGGALADCTVECPTHRFERQSTKDGLRLDLMPGAWLDRDVVILLTPREARPSLVVQATDAFSESAPIVVMAALQPPLSTLRQHIALKLLVDCSGSMGGDSIASARVALNGVLAGLAEGDHVSLSRFGSTVEHMAAPTACTPAARRRIAPLVDSIDANMGGTEMASALRAVFALPTDRDCDGADVLLLTDGEIWQAQTMIAAARASGHRVFAIGVGSAPAEGVLRSLAEATGGACEFVTPGEALEAAARRMLARIRQRPWREARIDWGTQPVWQTTLPTSVFGGDTVIALAGMATPTRTSTVRLLAADAGGGSTEIARGEADAPCPGDALPRMAAARRMAEASAADALKLAVTYQLMSKATNCILVHERAQEDKATGQAELHRVASMLAAGWGASATLAAPASQMRVSMSVAMDSIQACESFAPYDAVGNADFDLDLYSIQAASRPLPSAQAPAQAPLKAIAMAVLDYLTRGGPWRGLAAHCRSLVAHSEVLLALEQVVALGVDENDALALLAQWVNSRKGGMGDAVAAEVLSARTGGLPSGLVARSVEIFERALGGYAIDNWGLSRSQRLQRAMGRNLP